MICKWCYLYFNYLESSHDKLIQVIYNLDLCTGEVTLYEYGNYQ